MVSAQTAANANVNVNKDPRIDRMIPQRVEIACFGVDCFLGAEPRFASIPGIWRTTVGYAGGKREAPSFNDEGDHSEAVLVEYDPAAVSYGQLLEIFFLWRRPQRNAPLLFSRPHPRGAPCIFVKSEFEKRLAKAALERYELCWGDDCRTRIAKHGAFFEAEKWCQKYFLRASSPLMRELSRLYPDEESMIRSTLATRLNGLLGRRFSLSSPCPLPDDIEFYDLSEDALRTLQQLIA